MSFLVRALCPLVVLFLICAPGAVFVTGIIQRIHIVWILPLALTLVYWVLRFYLYYIIRDGD